MSRDPDLLPSVRTLGDRLGDAAEREIAAERAAAPRRRRRRLLRRALLGGGLAGLVVAGGVTATDVFTGTGPPVRPEPGQTVQPGVLTDSAFPDPAGGLPWALRFFVNDEGRECLQLGRLRDGAIGTVLNGQFRVYEGSPTGACGIERTDPLTLITEGRPQPLRTIVFGMSRGTSPVLVRIEGRTARVRPGALGAYVAVFEGRLDPTTAFVTSTIDGRRITHPPKGARRSP